MGLHPRGDVHRVSPDVVREPRKADDAGDDRARVDPDTQLDRVLVEERMDGDVALRYVRTRWEDPEGDFGRIQRQQDFLIALKAQILTPKLILQAPALIGQVRNTFETNLPVSDMPSLAKLVLGVSADAVVAVNIDYTNSRVYPEEAENGAKILRPNISRIQAFVVQTIGLAAEAEAGDQGRQLLGLVGIFTQAQFHDQASQFGATERSKANNLTATANGRQLSLPPSYPTRSTRNKVRHAG